jgi:hypothetical protein
MIQVVHPGSRSRIQILIFLPIPGYRIQGSKKAPDSGSRIRNIAYSTMFLVHLQCCTYIKQHRMLRTQINFVVAEVKLHALYTFLEVDNT